jgi:hypothetical protein
MKLKYFNKIIILTAVSVLLLLGSCKKFLDQRPITDASPDFVFSDVPGTLQALAAVYSRLSGDQGFGKVLSLYMTFDADEMQSPTGAGVDDRRDLPRYAGTSSNTEIAGPFNQLFQGIEYANICIDNIPKSPLYTSGTDQQKKQLQRMYGEALTLRAQFYSEAIKLWGDLPADFSPASALALGNPFPKRVDRDTLYTQLLNDLKIAEDLVPWRNELAAIGDQPDERITKGAVKGLRARIALFRGGYALRQDGTIKRTSDYLTYYQIANDECNDIIKSGQHSLNPGYKSLWKDQVCAHAVVDPNGELMFQASAFGSTSAEDTKLGYYDGPSMNANGNRSVNPLPTYFYLFDSTDLRRDVTIAPYNVTTNASNAFIKTGLALTALNTGKYRRDWNLAISPTDKIQFLGLKWQILRYSDVLLMFAETENEINGPTANAYDAINMVRRRGFGKPISTPNATVDLAGLSKADFFKAIVRERSLELGGEGVRRHDLVRWNLLAKAISETKTNLTNMGSNIARVPYSYMASPPAYCLNTPTLPIAMYYKQNSIADDATLWANSFYKTAPTSTPAGTTKVAWVTNAVIATGTGSPLGRFALGFITGKSELLPIPQGARDANYNLTQNPNY